MFEPTPTVKNRYQSIDLLRGIAILGILLMNINTFAFPEFNPILITDFTGLNYWSYAFVSVFFEGTMRGLFSMLFGASCLLILSKKENEIGAVDIYYRRLLWLFGFGLFNGYVLLWDGEILYDYAICGLFLFPFRNASAKWLIIIGLSITLIAFGKGAYKYIFVNKPIYIAYKSAMADSTQNHKKLTVNQKNDIEKFKGRLLFVKKDTAAINKNLNEIRGNYKSIYNKKYDNLDKAHSWAIYDNLFWDEILMMFIGMGLFKWGVFTNKLSKNKYWLMVFFGYAIGLPLKLFYTDILMNQLISVEAVKNFYETHWLNSRPFYDILRIAQTVGHVGLIMLIYNSGFFNFFVKVISKAGQMALSNYLLQSILCGLFFYGIGFGMFGRLQIYQTYLFVIVIWIICLIFSNIWLHYFQFGPAEWLWRSLTYWKKQPLKRETN
jgi:uncharacterized protein